MELPAANPPLPQEIGPYRVVTALTADETFLAIAPGGRQVVLKTLDRDCLLRGQLHPSIRERLARIRELAHMGVANLYGAERDGERVFCIWEHIPGVNLIEWSVAPGRTLEQVLEAVREMILSVNRLHSLGLVHGAIHARNVILTPAGAVKLTHISPLLYSDPLGDAAGLCAAIGEIPGALGAKAAELFALGKGGRRTMEDLVTAAKTVTSLGWTLGSNEWRRAGRREERLIQRRALLGALGLLAAGSLGGWGLWQWARRLSRQKGDAR